MKQIDNGYRCRRCHKKIWVPESIIRGMGPICYGKSYTIKTMLKQGLTREEILKIPKEEMKHLVKETLQRHKRKQKRLQKKKVKLNAGKIRSKKIKSKKDKNQKTLDSFLVSFSDKNRENALRSPVLDSKANQVSIQEIPLKSEKNIDDKIEKLKKELYSITNSLSKTNGSVQRRLSDRVFELMDEIKKLEGK